MEFGLEKPGPDMNIGIFITQRYFLSKNKYDAGYNCASILKKVFRSKHDRDSILNIYHIWMKRRKKDQDFKAYDFKCFDKAFNKVMNK